MRRIFSIEINSYIDDDKFGCRWKPSIISNRFLIVDRVGYGGGRRIRLPVESPSAIFRRRCILRKYFIYTESIYICLNDFEYNFVDAI